MYILKNKSKPLIVTTDLSEMDITSFAYDNPAAADLSNIDGGFSALLGSESTVRIELVDADWLRVSRF